MASISQLKLPDNTIYNIKGSIHNVIGTQTASTNSWTGNLTSIDALYDGLTIAYYLPYAGSGKVSLNLTLKNNVTTGAINCYLNNDTQITTQYKDGSIVCLTYFSAGSISIDGTPTTSARWVAQMGYEMVILSYGSSTWNDFIVAYNTNSLVYCRASSNSNPASGNQTRMAFMAYVNSNPPTEVEFQYYRSVSSHSATQQGDQVYIYKLNKNTGWSVTVREAKIKMAAGQGLTSNFASNTLTFSLASAYGDTQNPYGTKTANYVLAGPTSGTAAAPTFRQLVAADIPDLSGTYLTSFTETDPIFTASAAHGISSSDISNWNSKADGTHTHDSYVNQNAFSNIKVGSTTVVADNTTDTLELTAGNNITLTPDATNDKITIAATDTTYSNATTSANGLMSATDKIKTDSLSGIYPVIGTQTAATASWTGAINASALYDGMTIAYYLPYAGVSGTNVTLNLTLSNGTTTGAINCYFNNASRITTHYGAGATILLTYWSAGSISVEGTATTDNRWTRCDYDSNTKNTAGSTNSTSKLFLIGATSQAANPTTYSRSTAYVGTDGHLYSNGIQAVNLSGSQALTNKTYNGYTLAAACAKGVDTSISSTSSTKLPTTAAVTSYTDNIIVISENKPTSALTKIWIKI